MILIFKTVVSNDYWYIFLNQLSDENDDDDSLVMFPAA